jgi:hypothetical protein
VRFSIRVCPCAVWHHPRWQCCLWALAGKFLFTICRDSGVSIGGSLTSFDSNVGAERSSTGENLLTARLCNHSEPAYGGRRGGGRVKSGHVGVTVMVVLV